MADLVAVNEAIEGLKVSGQSRKPLQRLTAGNQGGRVVHRWKARFDVSATATEMLVLGDDVKALCHGASLALSDQLKCQTAIVTSLKAKTSGEAVTMGSATHQTNVWSFPQQTAAQIVAAHAEILNAIEKRKRESAPKGEITK